MEGSLRSIDGIQHKPKKEEDFGAKPKVIVEKKTVAKDDFFSPKHLSSNKNHLKPARPDRHRVNLPKVEKSKLLAILLLICLLVVVRIGYGLSKKKSEAIQGDLEAKVAVIQQKIGQVEVEANDGNISAAVNDLTDLKVDIIDLKKFTQAWGQNIQYFQIFSNSGLTQKERLLNTAYESILLIEQLPDDLKKLQATSYLGKEDNIADIQSFRTQLSALLEKLDKFAQSSKTNLTGINYVQSLMPKLDQMTATLSFMKDLVNNDLFWLSGEDGKDKNIIVIFQNNRELRGGSGGSFGSFGIARIKGGKLQKIDFGTNIYKFDAAFLAKGNHLPAPSELEAFGNDWTLKQSGFAVDGQEALDKIRWFYEQETGEKVDGAVTIDTDAFVSLFRVVGPIEMPQYGKTLNADNFVSETMDEVQNDYFNRTGGKTENEPKKIIGDMMPIFLQKLFASLNDKQKSYQIYQSIKGSFEQKHILLNFSKDDLEQKMIDLNLAGSVEHIAGDYLYVNNSNLAGAKSNQSMTQNITLNANISKEGKIVDNLTVERIHNGLAKAPDGLDRNYLRVLIPDGSKVTTFDAVKGNFQRYYDRGYKGGQPYWTDREAGKATINFWMSTMPQHSSKAQMTYEPNYNIGNIKSGFTYVINFQRQPGAPADNIELNLTYPKGYYPLNIDNPDQLGNTLRLKFRAETDKEIRIKFAKSIISE